MWMDNTIQTANGNQNIPDTTTLLSPCQQILHSHAYYKYQCYWNTHTYIICTLIFLVTIIIIIIMTENWELWDLKFPFVPVWSQVERVWLMWCLTVHNRFSVESCAAPTVATIGCLKSQSTNRPRKAQEKNQCSHLHRNINCLERRRVIFVNERLFLTACIVILCISVVFFSYLRGQNNSTVAQ